jgi:hypothetical protein
METQRIKITHNKKWLHDAIHQLNTIIHIARILKRIKNEKTHYSQPF